MEDEVELCPYCKHRNMIVCVDGRFYVVCGKRGESELKTLQADCPWFEEEDDEDEEPWAWEDEIDSDIEEELFDDE